MCQKLASFKSLSKILSADALPGFLPMGASEERKFLAREEVLLVLDKPTGIFLSPDHMN